MFVKRLSFVMLALVLVGASAFGAVINVTDWAGVVAATPGSGDTVSFAAGTYAATSQVALVSGVTYSGAGDTTIIDCGSANRAFTAWGTRETSLTPAGTGQTGWTISNMKIINGMSDTLDRDDNAGAGPITNGDKSLDGGAIIISNGGSGTISFVNFVDCATDATVGDDGGAIKVQGGGSGLTLNTCTFTTCTSRGEGGAMRATGDGGTVTVDNCDFTDCTATDDGGALDLGDERAYLVQDCDFLRCAVLAPSVGDGGALRFFGGGEANVVKSTFTECTTPGDGGGINLTGGDSSTQHTITDCTFTDCSVTGDDKGGGVRFSGGTNCTVTGSTFTRCLTNNDVGGGIGSTSADNKLTVENCTFTDCVAGSGGTSGDDGAISVQNTGSLWVSNSIFTGNSCDDDRGAIGMGSSSGPPVGHIINCLFVNNTSGDDQIVRLRNTISSKFINNTMVNNVPGDQGPLRIDTSADGSYVVSNNIFIGNTSQAGDAFIEWEGSAPAGLAGLIVSNNCFFGNAVESGRELVQSSNAGVDAGVRDDTVTETGRIEADPALDGSYIPTAGSPVIDAGDAAQAPDDDIRGWFAVDTRDIGAFEFGAEEPGDGSDGIPVRGMPVASVIGLGLLAGVVALGGASVLRRK